jgi:predicted metal-dependent peptidase
LDTSDSINNKLLRGFLRECKNILKQSRLKVGCFDTKFYGFHEIKTLSDIDNMILEGGGGTNFEVAVNAFTRRVENKIIFTDGYASMPNTSIDVIWIVFGNKKKIQRVVK